MTHRYHVLLPGLVAFLLAGCGATSAAPTPTATPRQSVTVAMGYIPSVQFAPFYVALAKGYYKEAGLNVTLNYGTEPDLLRLASVGKVTFVDSGGDEVMTAGAQGLGVETVLTQYTRFPSALFALRSSHLTSLKDLKGKTVGVPGTYGASYVGLLVALHHAGLSASSVKIQSIGYTQVAAVLAHKVTAAMGYATNEPVELRSQGMPVTEFDIWHWANIAGAGLATSKTEIARHPALVRAFVQATRKGLEYTLHHPAAAWAITQRAIPDVTRPHPTLQHAVFVRTMDFWQPRAGLAVGCSNPQVFTTTARLLYQFKQIPVQVNAAQYYTNRFLSGC